MALPSSTSLPGDFAQLDEQLAGGRLESVLHRICDGVIVEDERGAIVWANEAAGRLAGVGWPTELVGRALGCLRRELADEAGQRFDPAQLPGARLLRGDAAETKLVRLRDAASGRVWWVSVSASLIPGVDGQSPLAASIWHDVTSMRRREESAHHLACATAVLSESLDYGATLRRLATVLVPEIADWYCVDVLEDGELRTLALEHVDPAKAALAREVLARRPRRLDDESGLGAVVRTGRSELLTDVDDRTLVETACGDEELLAMLQALRPNSVLFVPLEAHERTFGAMKLLRGRSGRRYDELDRAYAEELGRRVGMTIENTRAYREAREATRLRDEFLVIAGHELRTPLTALELQLQGVAVTLRRGEPSRDQGEVARGVDKTIKHAGRLQQLIDHLLDVSHITSGRIVLDCQDTDLAELWRAVIERHAPEAARTGSAVSFTSTGNTVGCWDRARIDQVLTSLLGNALKYGQGRPVRVSVEGDAGTATTRVQDEGMGIDLTAQPRMFARFERAVSVRNYGGFGLGLWIVRELVEAHGGTVGFESQPGRGSTFSVELPRAPGRGVTPLGTRCDACGQAATRTT